MQWNLNNNKTSYHFSEQCGIFFSYGYRSHFSEQCCTVSSYGDILLDTFNYCMQWNIIQKKIFPLQLTMWYLFLVMETDPISVNKVVLFLSYGDILLNLFNWCMHWNLNLTKKSSHFSEQVGTYFQLWRHNRFQWTMWCLFQLLRQITQPL